MNCHQCRPAAIGDPAEGPEVHVDLEVHVGPEAAAPPEVQYPEVQYPQVQCRSCDRPAADPCEGPEVRLPRPIEVPAEVREVPVPEGTQCLHRKSPLPLQASSVRAPRGPAYSERGSHR